jgi:tetratricopeptide (TPR) repeat protein
VRRSTTLSDDGFFRDRGGNQRRPAADRDGASRDRTPGFRGNAGKPADRDRTAAPTPAPAIPATTTGTTTVTGGSGGPARGGSGFLDRVGDRLRSGPTRTAGGNGGSGGSVGGFGTRYTGGGSVASTTTVSSDLYRSAWRNGYRVGSRDAGCGWYHDWYDRNRWYLSFSFGSSCGPFFGFSYYRPFHSFVLGLDYAFFYPAPVSYCYVPYGFYCGATPYYVTRYQYVRAPVVVYEERVTCTTEEIEGRAPAATGADASGDEPKAADPLPAAGSPATEKFLREASDHFRKKQYYEAAVQFRLAALSSPELPGPLFALGQSLLAMGQDAYAARVTRRAVEMSPKLLEETGDVAGVFADQAEFDRVLKELEARAEAAPVDGDARFLLAAERFFTGDVRCRESLDALHVAKPMDEAVDLFRAAAARRFKAAEELPAIPEAKPAK